MADDEVMVGTVVGESTTQEFRMAVTPGRVHVQDLVAVDAQIEEVDGKGTVIRIWAKVEAIERINPLFPRESGQELADLLVNPFDTVISLSREMITALCRVLGYEEKGDDSAHASLGKRQDGALRKLRYPPQPASAVYRPRRDDLQRIIMGELQAEQLRHRQLDLGWLATRQDVDLLVDGHPIVALHVAILAMTGAGKSWTARRIIEQLATKHYPIVVFDPHGEYTGLEPLAKSVTYYHGSVDVLQEDTTTVMQLVNVLGGELTGRMPEMFDRILDFAKGVLLDDDQRTAVEEWMLGYYPDNELARFHLQPNLFGVMYLTRYLERAAKTDAGTRKGESKPGLEALQDFGFDRATELNKMNASTLDAIHIRLRRAAFTIRRMETINRAGYTKTVEVPREVEKLVRKGAISVINLSGYSHDLQASIYNLVLQKLFDQRIQGFIKLPFVVVIEEAHNFVPAHPLTDAERASTQLTKTIASEGRKFGVGLIMISQRPSRLDDTALTMCNSFIIMRLVNPADQRFVKAVIETVGEEEAKLLPDLDRGEALISGQCVQFPVMARIKPPHSQGEKQEKDLIRLVMEEE